MAGEPMDRDAILDDASRRYLLGKISLDELTAIRRRYRLDRLVDVPAAPRPGDRGDAREEG